MVRGGVEEKGWQHLGVDEQWQMKNVMETAENIYGKSVGPCRRIQHSDGMMRLLRPYRL